jgi:AhpD family alkylhydroperoxidase
VIDPAPGDVLLLTKPLGTGVLSFARQIGREYPEGFAAAEESMMTLNRAAAVAMQAAGASACTDVTGFGLFAHLRRMLRASGLGAEIFGEALPAFPDAIEALREGVIPGAIERNREYVGDAIEAEPGIDDAWMNLGFDAQTSGGLLIAVPGGRLAALREALAGVGAGTAVIGRIAGGAAGKILVKRGRVEEIVAGPKTNAERNQSMNHPENEAGAHGEGCCAEVFNTAGAVGTAGESQKAFGELMRAVQAGGALDAKTKELILFSLVVASRCQPCFESHYRRARELGLTQAQLDEAAWCAIAMGGAPVKMFYQECLRQAGA